MWTYEQKSGWASDAKGFRLARGYAGAGAGKNNPAMQNVKNVGPLPCGVYDVEEPSDTVTHGPFVLRLQPRPENEMFGRDGFLIHGDSVVSPGTASEGCIILPRFAREKIWASGDRELTVVSGEIPKEIT